MVGMLVNSQKVDAARSRLERALVKLDMTVQHHQQRLSTASPSANAGQNAEVAALRRNNAMLRDAALTVQRKLDNTIERLRALSDEQAQPTASPTAVGVSAARGLHPEMPAQIKEVQGNA